MMRWLNLRQQFGMTIQQLKKCYDCLYRTNAFLIARERVMTAARKSFSLGLGETKLFANSLEVFTDTPALN